MAQEAADADAELLENVKLSAPAGDAREDFVKEALSNLRDALTSNRSDAARMNMLDDGSVTVDDVLSAENVREIEVRARPYENPRFTVWLSDAPTWANDAGNDYCYPKGLNAYNGKVHYVWDSRPF